MMGLGLAAFSLLVGQPTAPWVCSRSGATEVLMQADAQTASDLLKVLVSARRVLQRRLIIVAPERPLRVFLLPSEETFRRWAPDGLAAAYFISGTRRDFIVMRSDLNNRNAVALHELTHQLCSRTLRGLPPWLKEGLAEFGSTITFRGQKAIFEPIAPARATTLESTNLLPLSVLLKTERIGGTLQDRFFLVRFYAQSAALVSMLLLDPAYESRAAAFMAKVPSVGSESAFESIYGKTKDALESDFAAWRTRLLRKNIPKTQEIVDVFPDRCDVAALPPCVAQEIFSELLADQPWTQKNLPGVPFFNLQPCAVQSKTSNEAISSSETVRSF